MAYDPGNLEGLIPLLGGVAALLISLEKIPVKNKDFVTKHKKWLKPLSIVVILFGLLTLSGVMRPG